MTDPCTINIASNLKFTGSMTTVRVSNQTAKKLQSHILRAARHYIKEFTATSILAYSQHHLGCSKSITHEDLLARVIAPLIAMKKIEIVRYSEGEYSQEAVYSLYGAEREKCKTAESLTFNRIVQGEVPVIKAKGITGEFTRKARTVGELPTMLAKSLLFYAAEVLGVPSIEYGVPIWQTLNMTNQHAQADGRQWILYSGKELPLSTFINTLE